MTGVIVVLDQTTAEKGMVAECFAAAVERLQREPEGQWIVYILPQFFPHAFSVWDSAERG